MATSIETKRREGERERERGAFAYVGVKLPDEAGEVIVLEVLGKQIFSELRWIPHDETVVVTTPRHYRIRSWIVDHVVGLAQERRRRVST